MYEIRELTGQDYRNVYAGKTADTEPTVVAKVATLTDRRVRARRRVVQSLIASCG